MVRGYHIYKADIWASVVGEEFITKRHLVASIHLYSLPSGLFSCVGLLTATLSLQANGPLQSGRPIEGWEYALLPLLGVRFPVQNLKF